VTPGAVAIACCLTFAAGVCSSCWSQDAVRGSEQATPKYLSDVPGSAFHWLEEQQKAAYGPMSGPQSLQDLKRIVMSLPRREGWEAGEKLLEAVGIENVELPTRYEDIGAYFLLNNLSVAMRKELLAERPGWSPPPLYWGTLPHGEVNAAAQRVGKESLVILNHGIFRFLYGALLTIDRTVVLEPDGRLLRLDFSDEAFKQRIQSDPKIRLDFALLVQSFSDMKVSAPELKYASAEEAPLVISQLNSVETFIVGHEFAHVEAGDGAAGRRAMEFPERGGRYRRIAPDDRDWGQELRADARGLELGRRARLADKTSKRSSMPEIFEGVEEYAPLLFLALADALEDVRFCAASGEGDVERLSFEDVFDVLEHARAVRDRKQSERADKVRKALGCRMQSHPPAWVRAKLIEPLIDAKTSKAPFKPPVGVSFGKSLVANARHTYVAVAPALRAYALDYSQRRR
jgi:hypothetical protein